MKVLWMIFEDFSTILLHHLLQFVDFLCDDNCFGESEESFE